MLGCTSIIYLPTYSSIYLPSSYLSIYLSIYLSACMPAYASPTQPFQQLGVGRVGRIGIYLQAASAGLHRPSLTLPRWTKHGRRGVATVGRLSLSASVVRRRGMRLRCVSGGYMGSSRETRSRGRWNTRHNSMSTAVAITAVVPTPVVAAAALATTRTRTRTRTRSGILGGVSARAAARPHCSMVGSWRGLSQRST